MGHAASTAHHASDLNFHLIPYGSVCPGSAAERHSVHAAKSEVGRLIPLGSVCPDPPLTANAAGTEGFRVAPSLVPPGSICPNVVPVTGIDEIGRGEQIPGMGSRLIPSGSRCMVSTETARRELLSEPTFATSFLASNRMPGFSRSRAMACSLIIQTLLLAIVVVAPLVFAASPDLRNFAVTLLVAPPPPLALPAPLPAAPRAIASQPSRQSTFVRHGKMTFPVAIPKHAVIVDDAPAEVNPDALSGGVWGGLPADLAGVISAGVAEPAPPPPPLSAPSAPLAPVITQPTKPLQVGGNVRAPHALSTVEPQYPLLARQARIEGDVVVSAIIDPEGNVVEMKAISGPPMLYPAALAALRQWRFEPTYLNGTPWPIQYEVTLHFRIGAGRR
jgi:protein TonB